jgi:hypothetical protein
MLATDRDLLSLEPNVFRDVGWIGQRLVKGTCTIAGTTMTMLTQDVTLEAAGVGAGFVAVVDGTAYEVIARLSATAATVSRVRGSASEPILPPSPVTNVAVVVPTMRPQMAMIERQVLRMAGLEPGTTPGTEASPTEGNIVKPEQLARLVTLGALHVIFAAAAAPGEPGSIGASGSPVSRAEMYRRRFAEERSRVIVELDLDGDGEVDATRRLNAMQLVRG